MKTQISSALLTFLNGLCEGNTGGGSYSVIDLYTVTLLSSTVLRIAAWDAPVIYGGHTYLAAGPYLSRTKIRQSLKAEVSQIQLRIEANPTMTVDGSSILASIASGAWSGATVQVDRLFARTVNPLDTALGTVKWFLGFVAEVEELGRAHTVLTVKDMTALLSSPHPRNLFTTGCRHVLFDPGCTLSAAGYLVSTTCSSGATTTVIPTPLSSTTYPGPLAAPSSPTLSATAPFSTGVNLPAAQYFVVITYGGAAGESMPSPEANITITGGGQNATTNKLLKVTSPGSSTGATTWNVYAGIGSGNEQLQANNIAIGTDWTELGSGLTQGVPPPYQQNSGWFALGVLLFTSGANAGRSRIITEWDGTKATVMPPLPVAPSSGDGITLLPGCERSLVVCQQKFNNVIHFAGQPFSPDPAQSV